MSRLPIRTAAGTTCRPFPTDNYWNTDIGSLPVDPRSATWLSHMSSDRRLHPDFGPSYGDGPNYGIPITVVGRHHPTVRVRFDYAVESNRVRATRSAGTHGSRAAAAVPGTSTRSS